MAARGPWRDVNIQIRARLRVPVLSPRAGSFRFCNTLRPGGHGRTVPPPHSSTCVHPPRILTRMATMTAPSSPLFETRCAQRIQEVRMITRAALGRDLHADHQRFTAGQSSRRAGIVCKVRLWSFRGVRRLIAYFLRRLQESGGPVRFHCGLPTWCPDSECCKRGPRSLSHLNSTLICTGLDLYDLHDLKSRFLVFIHGLVESLAAAGVRPLYFLYSSHN
jgi:hypothetical protein